MLHLNARTSLQHISNNYEEIEIDQVGKNKGVQVIREENFTLYFLSFLFASSWVYAKEARKNRKEQRRKKNREKVAL